METTLEQKGDAQLAMVKAYITYASSDTLEGYESAQKRPQVESRQQVRGWLLRNCK